VSQNRIVARAQVMIQFLKPEICPRHDFDDEPCGQFRAGGSQPFNGGSDPVQPVRERSLFRGSDGQDCTGKKTLMRAQRGGG